MEPRFESLLRRLEHLSAEVQELREGIRQSVMIAAQDPEMSLTRARKVLEYIVRDVYQHAYAEPAGTRPLENLLQRLGKDGHFPKRLAAYANGIRELGNVGTHGFGEGVTVQDVFQSLTQLVPIVEWYFQQRGPAPAAPSPDRDAAPPIPRAAPDASPTPGAPPAPAHGLPSLLGASAVVLVLAAACVAVAWALSSRPGGPPTPVPTPIIGPPPKAQPPTLTEITVTGKAVRMDRDKLTFHADGVDKTVPVPAEAQVLIDGSEGRLDDIKKDGDIVVTSKGGVVSKVEVRNPPPPGVTVTGTFVRVVKDKLTATVGGKEKTFTVPDTTKVTIDDREATLAAIKNDSTVTVTSNGDAVITVEAKSPPPPPPTEKTIRGKVTKVEEDKLTIREADDKEQAFTVPGDAEATIDGKDGRLTDVKVDSTVTVTSKGEVVTKIEAKSPNTSPPTKAAVVLGNVVGVDKDRLTVRVGEKESAFLVPADAKVVIDYKEGELDDVKKDSAVAIVAVDDTVLAVVAPNATAVHALVRDGLKNVINEGADMYNATGKYEKLERDTPGCYHLYQGALIAVRPLLASRPDLQKAIDDGLETARTTPEMDKRAFPLRDVLDKVRDEVNPNKSKGDVVTKVEAKSPDVSPPPKAAIVLGKVVGVDKDRLTVGVDEKEMAFTVPAAAKVVIDCKEGELDDLKKDSAVAIVAVDGAVLVVAAPNATAVDALAREGMQSATDEGAGMYNADGKYKNQERDYAGCHHLYQGALMAVRPLLASRPALQKAIDDGLEKARGTPVVSDRAFVLRQVIDDIRKAIKPE